MYPVIHLTNDIFLPSYFLIISIGFMVGMIWLVRRTDRAGLNRNIALDACLIIMVGALIGSRLFHILWEHPDYYSNRPWDVFKLWQGGFVFYGGVIGSVIPVLFYMHRRSQSVIQWLDVFAPVIPLSYGIGRFATFLSGSGYGKPTDLPWGVQFPPGTEAPSGVSVHPTQIYSMLWQFAWLYGLLLLERRLKVKPRSQRRWAQPGGLFFIMMIGHGVGRGVWEQFRNDFRGWAPLGLSVSSWISLMIIGIGVYGLTVGFGKKEEANS